MHTHTHPCLPGVEVRGNPLKPPRRGEAQVVFVTMEADAKIPLHTHGGDARMLVMRGSARILSEDERNGKTVRPGDLVVFRAGERHGFQAGPEGMTFRSDNEGIVDARGNWDIMF